MNIKNLKFDLLHYAAIGTWATVLGISLYGMMNSSSEIPANLFYVLFFFVTYLISFIVVSLGVIPKANIKLIVFFILTQLLSAFALIGFLDNSFLSILTVIWVAILPHYMSIKKATIVLIVMVIAWFGLYSLRWDNGNVLFAALLFSSFHFFSLLMAQTTIDAEKSADEAARLNKELKSAQYLLEQATRQNERTRIARDLHDLVGHHLTALIINLQVAGHLSGGEAKEKVDQCHSLAKLLLSDVREAVSTMRENQSLDFRKMVDLMIENIPELVIHNQIDTDLNLENLNLAKSLLSCVQEATTNCLRHSGATELWISMKEADNSLLLEIYDNGKLSKHFLIGNGLKGMQERVEELNGEISFDNVNQSMHINIEIPLSYLS